MNRPPLGAALLLALSACAGGGTAGRPSGPGPAVGAGPGADAAAETVDRVAGARPAGPIGYVAHRVDSVVFQLPGGASQAQVQGRTAWLRLSVVQDGEGLRAEFVLDSLRPDPGTFLPGLSLDSAAGTRITGRLLPSGGLTGLVLNPHSSLVDLLAQDLDRHLFPPVPGGKPTPGTRWTDSATAVSGAEWDQSFTRDSVWTSYQATRPEDGSPAGRDGLVIQAASEVRRAGRNTQGDQRWEISGGGRDSTTYVFDRAGVLLTLTGHEVLRLDYLVPAVGQTVPVQAIGRYRVRRMDQPAP